MRMIIGLIVGLFLLSNANTLPNLPAERFISSVIVSPAEEDGDHQIKALRAGRGSFRSPRSGYTGGNRQGVTDGRGQRPDANNPVNRAPAAPGRFGGLFGGILMGTFLGSLLNPFGFGGTGGFSLIGLLFWGVILYFVFRVIRRMFGGAR